MLPHQLQVDWKKSIVFSVFHVRQDTSLCDDFEPFPQILKSIPVLKWFDVEPKIIPNTWIFIYNLKAFLKLCHIRQFIAFILSGRCQIFATSSSTETLIVSYFQLCFANNDNLEEEGGVKAVLY